MYPYSPYTLKRIYEQCRWHRGELDNQRLRKFDPLGREHFLHQRRTQQWTKSIRRFLRALSPQMMRSHGGIGMPWQSLAYIERVDVRYSDEYAATLFVLAEAAGLLSWKEVKLPDVLEPQIYVQVSDLYMNSIM